MDYCRFCSTTKPPYLCPRCNAPYCSLKCYRGPSHVDCAEGFYKDCVTSELKSDKTDRDVKRRTLEALARVKAEEDEEALDSDDEEDLEDRLRGVCLDDFESVWGKLTEEERKGFLKRVETGEIEKLLPKYVPWWCKEEKLIREVDKDDDELPAIAEKIPDFKSNVETSFTVPYSLLNLLYAYAYASRFFYGDYETREIEFAEAVFGLSDNLNSNAVYDSVDTALESGASKVDPGYSTADKNAKKTAKKDVVEIVCKSYFLNALSDLANVFRGALEACTKNEISRNITKKQLKMSVKKIEFYLSWAKSNFKSDFLTFNI